MFLLIGMMSNSQQILTADCVIETMINAIDKKIPDLNSIYFEDYSCESSGITKTNKYIYISGPNDEYCPMTFTKHWEKSITEYSVSACLLDDDALHTYMGLIAEQDSSEEFIDGYERTWSDPWFSYKITRHGDQLNIVCHRYYDYD